jgi:hypothetical protein
MRQPIRQQTCSPCASKRSKEIAKVLRSDEDPIDSAADAIVESHEAILRRSDAQRRKAVLGEIEAVRIASPLPFPMAAEPIELTKEAA